MANCALSIAFNVMEHLLNFDAAKWPDPADPSAVSEQCQANNKFRMYSTVHYCTLSVQTYWLVSVPCVCVYPSIVYV